MATESLTGVRHALWTVTSPRLWTPPQGHPLSGHPHPRAPGLFYADGPFQLQSIPVGWTLYLLHYSTVPSAQTHSLLPAFECWPQEHSPVHLLCAKLPLSVCFRRHRTEDTGVIFLNYKSDHVAFLPAILHWLLITYTEGPSEELSQGSWVAQWVGRLILILGFGSGLGLKVVRLSPASDSVLSRKPASPSLK